MSFFIFNYFNMLIVIPSDILIMYRKFQKHLRKYITKSNDINRIALINYIDTNKDNLEFIKAAKLYMSKIASFPINHFIK